MVHGGFSRFRLLVAPAAATVHGLQEISTATSLAGQKKIERAQFSRKLRCNNPLERKIIIRIPI
jgi:hypothetical protein